MESRYFDIKELVCPHVYSKFGKFAWNFVDYKVVYLINDIRGRLNKPITVNNGELTQRGLRCPHCEIVKKKLEEGALYMSAHTFGKAFDFDVEGLTAEEVRLYLVAKKSLWPYAFRLEKNVTWVHLDIFTEGLEKITFFEP